MKHLFVLFAVFALACGGRVSRDNEANPEEYADLVSNETGGSSSVNSLPEIAGEAGSPSVGDSVEEGGNADIVEDPSGEAGSPPNTGGSPATGGTSSTGGNPSIDPIDDGSEGGNDPVLATGGSATTSTGGSIIAQAGASFDVETGGSDPIVIPVENGGEGGSAGSSPSIIGNGGAAGSDAGCTPKLRMELVSHSSEMIVPGTSNFTAMQFRLTALCQNLEVQSSDFNLSALDHEPEDVGPHFDANGNRNFQNVRILDPETGVIVAGPISPTVQAQEQSHLLFDDSFVLNANEPRLLSIVLDVSETFRSDVESTSYTVYHNFVDAGVPMVMAYAQASNPWSAFTVWDEDWQPCVHLPTQTLSIETASESIRGGSDGFMLLGYARDADETSQAELQFWDRNGNQGASLNVGPNTSLLAGFSDASVYVADVEWPILEGGYGQRQLSVLSHDGAVSCASQLIADGRYNQQVLAGRNVYVSVMQSMQSSIWGSSFTDDGACFNGIERIFDWQDMSALYIISAAESGNMTAMLVNAYCNPIPVYGECPESFWLVLWDHTVPAAERQVTYVEHYDAWPTDLFPEEDGFGIVSSTSVSHYSLSGELRDTVVMPEKVRRLIPDGNGGYVAIVTGPDSLRSFTFLLLDANGVVTQSIPFEGDVDRYELAVSRPVRFGENRFAFTWGSLGTESDRRGRLEQFECR